MITSIDEMIVRAAKRYVELYLLIAEIPPAVGRNARKELARQKGAIERMLLFRNALISNRPPHAPLVSTSTREHIRWRYESRPERRA